MARQEPSREWTLGTERMFYNAPGLPLKPMPRYHFGIAMPRRKMQLIRTTISVTPEQREWLRRKEFETRREMTDLVRDILEEARIRDEPQERLPLQ